MRKIKFRLWDVEEKCFMNHSHVIESRVLALENNGEGRFIFQQWTGLLDRQGREIYEGDIVHAYTAESNGYGKEDYISAEITGVVTFKDISFGLQVGNIFNNLWTNAETFVVEGNIYENPELLEGK